MTERMEKMAEEKPVMEEPVEESTTQELSAEDQAKEILAELDNLGINSVEKVQGMATASSESGNLARMLGEVRQQNDQLQRQIQEMNQAQRQYEPEYGEQPVDLAKIVRNEIRGFYSDEVVKPQMEQTNRVYGELSAIQSDPDYPLVQQVWEKHWNAPQTQHLMMTGHTGAKEEYEKVVRTYYREAFLKTSGALRGVMDKKATPPHVEVGDQTHVNMPTQSDETRENIKNIVKSSQGSDQDIEALVKAMLPQDDPMFKR